MKTKERAGVQGQKSHGSGEGRGKRLQRLKGMLFSLLLNLLKTATFDLLIVRLIANVSLAPFRHAPLYVNGMEISCLIPE